MRLLLTSNGFPEKNKNARKELLKLVSKPLKDIRVAFVPTASEVEEDKAFMLVDRKELEEMGILAENITNLNLDHTVTLAELKQYDVIFVDGGNTFYLLQKVRESGFDRVISEYLEKDLGVYVGVSAGTMLVGTNIELAEPWDDKTLSRLEDTKGLELIDTVYSPHYVEEEKEIIEKYRNKVSYPIQELPDGHAVIIVNGNLELIKG